MIIATNKTQEIKKNNNNRMCRKLIIVLNPKILLRTSILKPLDIARKYDFLIFNVKSNSEKKMKMKGCFKKKKKK